MANDKSKYELMLQDNIETDRSLNLPQQTPQIQSRSDDIYNHSPNLKSKEIKIIFANYLKCSIPELDDNFVLVYTPRSSSYNFIARRLNEKRKESGLKLKRYLDLYSDRIISKKICIKKLEFIVSSFLPSKRSTFSDPLGILYSYQRETPTADETHSNSISSPEYNFSIINDKEGDGAIPLNEEKTVEDSP